MTTAETVKTIITDFDWTSVSYGETPTIVIIGIDNLDHYPTDYYIHITDNGEEPEFTANGVRLMSPQSCKVELKERNTTKRTNLYEGLKKCFQESTYEITFSRVKPFNMLQPYVINLEVNILL